MCQFWWRSSCVCVCITFSFSVCVCSMNGALAFVDTSDCTMMNIAEHYMASDVEWDPTGRYVVTSVSWWSHKVHKITRLFLSCQTCSLLMSGNPYWTYTHILFVLCVCRWTMHTGCGRSRAVFFRRTTRTASVSFSGDPDLPPCSAQTRSRYHFNFSDTSYESCSAAPYSNSDLRLTATTSCVLVHHIPDIVFVVLWVCGCGTFLYSKYPSASFRWSRRILRSTQRSLSRRIVWASPRPQRFDLFISLTDPGCSLLQLTFYLVEFVGNLKAISALLAFSAPLLTS